MLFKKEKSRHFYFPGKICFLLLFCLHFFVAEAQNLSGKYKTLKDSVFEIGDIIKIPKVFFDLSRCSLMTDSTIKQIDSIKAVVAFLKSHPNLVVEIGNHTDRTCIECSKNLTRCRAKTYFDTLSKMGVDVKRLSYEGYGASRPFVTLQDIKLFGGKIIPKGTVLTEAFRNKFKSNKNDYEFLCSLCRRMELKITDTEYGN